MALEVTNEIQSTASNHTVAQAKYIADDDFMTAHSTTDNKQNTINEWLANQIDSKSDTTYKLTLNGTTKGDGDNGEDLGTLYAPTEIGTSGQYLRSTGNGAPAWSSLPEYRLRILGGTSAPVNRIQLYKLQGTSTLGTWSVDPKLYYKTNSSASGVGTTTDIRLYAGDNITLERVNETVTSDEEPRSGVKISANVPSADIPIASTGNPGKLKVSADANPTILYKNTGSVVGVPVFYSPNGNPLTYIDEGAYQTADQDVHTIHGAAQPFRGHYINIYDIITILSKDPIALNLLKSVLARQQ